MHMSITEIRNRPVPQRGRPRLHRAVAPCRCRAPWRLPLLVPTPPSRHRLATNRRTSGANSVSGGSATTLVPPSGPLPTALAKVSVVSRRASSNASTSRSTKRIWQPRLIMRTASSHSAVAQPSATVAWRRPAGCRRRPLSLPESRSSWSTRCCRPLNLHRTVEFWRVYGQSDGQDLEHLRRQGTGRCLDSRDGLVSSACSSSST